MPKKNLLLFVLSTALLIATWWVAKNYWLDQPAPEGDKLAQKKDAKDKDTAKVQDTAKAKDTVKILDTAKDKDKPADTGKGKEKDVAKVEVKEPPKPPADQPKTSTEQPAEDI